MLLREMEPQLRILAGNRKLDFEIQEQVKCSFDKDRIKQVILNLFHNAIQFTDPKKGRIRIALTRNNNDAQISFQDNGPGISNKHLPNIFNRFYRSDSSRTRKKAGPVWVDHCQIDHGSAWGSITVTAKKAKELTFHVRLPCSPIPPRQATRPPVIINEKRFTT